MIYKKLVIVLSILIIFYFGINFFMNPGMNLFPEEKFTEEECKALLIHYDPLISDIIFKEKNTSVGIFSDNIITKPPGYTAIWKVNVTGLEEETEARYIDGEYLSGKHVFFVESDKFEGCGLTVFNPTEKYLKGAEHYDCGNFEVFTKFVPMENYIHLSTLLVVRNESVGFSVKEIFYVSIKEGRNFEEKLEREKRASCIKVI